MKALVLALLICSGSVFGQKIDNYFPLQNVQMKYQICVDGRTAKERGLNKETWWLDKPWVENYRYEGIQLACVKRNFIGDEIVEIQVLFEVRKDGVFEIGSGGGILQNNYQKHNNPYPLLKYPIKLKKPWSYGDGKKTTYEVVEKLNSCIVDNTEYEDVIKVKITINDGGSIHTWAIFYANGVGRIKEEFDGKIGVYLISE